MENASSDFDIFVDHSAPDVLLMSAEAFKASEFAHAPSLSWTFHAHDAFE